MNVKRLLLVSVCLVSYFLASTEAQLITKPPKNITAALSTNATFSCRGNGEILWEISGIQVLTEDLQQLFAQLKIYVPLPTQNVSQIIITATTDNNCNRTIQCNVDPGITVGPVEESIPVYLLVYAQPHPPFNLLIEVDGLNLVATWTEPFSLEGEELSYVVSVINIASGDSEELLINTTRYVLDNPIGQRDCSEYELTVLSKNDYSRSNDYVSEKKHIPTEPLVLRNSDVSINVSFVDGVNATVIIYFKPRDPCPSYAVTSYTFNITERDTDNLTASIRHTGNSTLTFDETDGLVPGQVYRLVIEAENSVGSTLSEKILIYTTGLQSSTAVLELNGSITVTCTFAMGASSTGCQVTIFMMDNFEELFSINITRQNGATQAIENFQLDHDILSSVDYNRLLVQRVELLSGGRLGIIQFNGTISQRPTTITSTILSVTTPHLNGSSQFTIIIGALLGVISVIIFLIIMSICLLVLYKKINNKDLYNRVTPNNTYELSAVSGSIGSGRFHQTDISSMRNPTYTGEVAHDHTENERVAYPAYEDISLQTSRNINVTALDSRNVKPTRFSSERTSPMDQNRLPFLDPQLSPRTITGLIKDRYEMMEVPPSSTDELSSEINEDKSKTDTVVVPTDSVTGYSTLVRPDISKTLQSQDLVYDSIKVDDCRRAVKLDSDGGKQTTKESNFSSVTPAPSPGTITFESQTSVLALKVPGLQDGLQCLQKEMCVLPTDPETGYCMLKDDRARPPPGASPFYDTINLKDNATCLSVRNKSDLVMLSPFFTSSGSHDCGNIVVKSSHDLSLPQVRNSSYLPSDTQDVPTYLETGYSTMIRPEKSLPPSAALIPGYDRLDVKPNVDKEQKQRKTTCVAAAKACTQSPSPNSLISSNPGNKLKLESPTLVMDSKLHSPSEQVSHPTESTREKCEIPTDPETGYSTVLRPQCSNVQTTTTLEGYDIIKTDRK